MFVLIVHVPLHVSSLFRMHVSRLAEHLFWEFDCWKQLVRDVPV